MLLDELSGDGATDIEFDFGVTTDETFESG
jgi:hypothetical protein